MFDIGDIISMFCSLSVAHSVLNNKDEKDKKEILDKIPFNNKINKKWIKSNHGTMIKGNCNYYIKNLYSK